MRTRLLLVTAVLAVARLGLPAAHATVPGCMSLYTQDPYRFDRPGAHWVRGTVIFANYCSEIYSVNAQLQTKECDFIGGCHWKNMEGSLHMESGYNDQPRRIDSEAPCREGTNRYRLTFTIFSSTGATVHEGITGEPELTCSDDIPPPPSTPDCPKYTEQACYLIKPPH